MDADRWRGCELGERTKALSRKPEQDTAGTSRQEVPEALVFCERRGKKKDSMRTRQEAT